LGVTYKIGIISIRLGPAKCAHFILVVFCMAGAS
jgi:hypothetical protein